jgi:hypothetical protein
LWRSKISLTGVFSEQQSLPFIESFNFVRYFNAQISNMAMKPRHSPKCSFQCDLVLSPDTEIWLISVFLVLISVPKG